MCIHRVHTRRLQPLVAVFDRLGIKVFVNRLDGAVGHLSTLAQRFPAEHRRQDGLRNAPLSVALEEKALGFDPLVHVSQHVVGGSEHEPLALGDVHVMEIIVIPNDATVRVCAPGLRLALADAIDDCVGQRVNL